MASEDRQAVWQAQDAAVLGGLLRDGSDTGQVTRSGRCPQCAYLIGSPGHETACR